MKWRIGKIVRILDPGTGFVGTIKRDDGVMTEFALDDLEPGMQKLLKTGGLRRQRLLGWDVEFVPDGKGGVVDGTLKQRLTIIKG